LLCGASSKNNADRRTTYVVLASEQADGFFRKFDTRSNMCVKSAMDKILHVLDQAISNFDWPDKPREKPVALEDAIIHLHVVPMARESNI
jgi:hypothetical protein